MLRRLKFMGLALAGALVFASIVTLLHSMFVDAWNRKQLQELADHTINRADVAVDHVVITLSDLIAAGHANCGEEAIMAMRRAAFANGSIQDIHLFAAEVHCSGFAAIGLGSSESLKKAYRQPSRNPSITLSKVNDGSDKTLGLAWKFEPSKEFIVASSTDELLFDMLPGELREDASMALFLDRGHIVGRYDPDGWGSKRPEHRTEFKAASSRYPIGVRIVVDDAKLATWNRDVPLSLLLAMLALSLLFGGLVAKTLVRRPNPAEDLENAIAAGEVVPHFQPIVSLADSSIVGCEMLARWIKPDGTQVSPGRFIPLAELSGNVSAMTDSLLRQAGAKLGREISKRPSFKFTFNITPEQFLADGFVDSLRDLADEVGLPREQLVVELTERQEIDCGEKAQAVTAELEAIGVRVAIDDAGTGHNGLSSIQCLGASCLKIDKIFIDRIAEDRRTRALVEMLVSVAREYGMATVAEGIENSAQVAELQSLGIDDGQGFLFSKPLAAEPFRALLGTESVRALSTIPKRREVNIVLGDCPA